MGIVTEIINALTAWLTGILNLITDAVDGVVGIFYDGTALTVAGALLMFGLAFSLAMFGFNFIRGLIKK